MQENTSPPPETLPTIETQQPDIPSFLKSKKAKVIGLTILVIISLLLTSTIALNKVRQDKQPSPSTTPSTSQAPNGDLANWKTYTNEKYGLKLKYPPNWIVEETTDYAKSQDLILIGDPIYKDITGDWMEIIISFPDSIEDAISKIGSQFTKKTVIQKKININELNALVVTVNTPEIPNWEDTRTYIETDKHIYEINADIEENPTLNKILSSFQSTDTTLQDVFPNQETESEFECPDAKILDCSPCTSSPCPMLNPQYCSKGSPQYNWIIKNCPDVQIIGLE